jgi:hypothetical protein
MTDERLKQIEQIYHAASERDADQLSPFLDEACGADAELRREVETLLQQDEKSISLLKQAVMHINAAWQLNSNSIQLSAGMSLGPYILGHLIGSGGMGAVYQATDTRLNRTVVSRFYRRMCRIGLNSSNASNGKHRRSLV